MRGDFSYDLFLFLHILAAIVGFGSTFVWPMLASKARQLPPEQGWAITHAALTSSKVLTRPVIWGVGITGVVLVFLWGDNTDDIAGAFGEPWVSTSILLYVIAIAVSEVLHSPNLRAMDALGEKLASGQVGAPAAGGPPPEVAELQARGKKAGMFGGILHLMFFVILILMIWKPGT
jgi:hypothetical protein